MSASGARERWDTCHGRLMQADRPSVEEIRDLMGELANIPYPIEFRKAEIGSMLASLCRLCRYNAQVSLAQLCELIVIITSKHQSAVPENNMREIVTFLCANADGSASDGAVDASTRHRLLRALSAVVYGNGERCAHLIDGILYMLLPDVAQPYASPADMRIRT